MKGKAVKTAVITGAAYGLGKAYALEWARSGWRIGLVDIAAEEAERTLDEVRRAGGSGEVYVCDVSSLEEVQAMADDVFSAWGEVGLLINNAGVFGAGSVGDVAMEDWRRIIAINFWGVVHGCHAFIPRMREQGFGHIVKYRLLWRHHLHPGDSPL